VTCEKAVFLVHDWFRLARGPAAAGFKYFVRNDRKLAPKHIDLCSVNGLEENRAK
jgi:hypothetical protein